MVYVVAVNFEVFGVSDEVIGEPALPDGKAGGVAVGEAAFDVSDGSGEIVGGEEEVDVVGHDDEGVEFEEALVAVVLEGFDKEFGVGGESEEAAAVVGDGGDEEGAGGGGSWRLGHVGSLVGGWALGTAFGRAEGPAARLDVARLKPGPSGVCCCGLLFWGGKKADEELRAKLGGEMWDAVWELLQIKGSRSTMRWQC